MPAGKSPIPLYPIFPAFQAPIRAPSHYRTSAGRRSLQRLSDSNPPPGPVQSPHGERFFITNATNRTNFTNDYSIYSCDLGHLWHSRFSLRDFAHALNPPPPTLAKAEQPCYNMPHYSLAGSSPRHPYLPAGVQQSPCCWLASMVGPPKPRPVPPHSAAIPSWPSSISLVLGRTSSGAASLPGCCAVGQGVGAHTSRLGEGRGQHEQTHKGRWSGSDGVGAEDAPTRSCLANLVGWADLRKDDML